MKKNFMLVGAKTPILALIVSSLFILLFFNSANNYYVDKLTVLDAKIEASKGNNVTFVYKDKDHKIKVGTKIYLSFSRQSSLLEGIIIEAKNDTYVSKFKKVGSINERSVIKIVDGKEPIIRRLF